MTPLGTPATSGSIVPAPDDDDVDDEKWGGIGGLELARQIEELEENLFQ
jgi:hypothetical protein